MALSLGAARGPICATQGRSVLRSQPLSGSRLAGSALVLARPQQPRGALLARKAINSDKDESIGERVIAAIPYMLPLLDGIPYGKFLLFQYPFVARALSPLAPLAMVYNSVPLLPFLIFLGVYTGIVNNFSFSRFVRYHAMQAVLLDVLLIIPQIILNDVFRPPSDEIGMAIYIALFNTIFLYVTISVAYGMGSSAVGQIARLPLVAEAADTQVRNGPSGW